MHDTPRISAFNVMVHELQHGIFSLIIYTVSAVANKFIIYSVCIGVKQCKLTSKGQGLDEHVVIIMPFSCSSEPLFILYFTLLYFIPSYICWVGKNLCSIWGSALVGDAGTHSGGRHGVKSTRS